MPKTADDPDVELCVAVPGAKHDWRQKTYQPKYGGSPRTSFICVWCDAIACGNVGDHDPCLEPYHHRSFHVSRSGVRWLVGTQRPDV